MGILDYLSLKYGFLGAKQYAYSFALSFNPIIFKLFELRHFCFLAVGIALSLFNHRAVLPFILLILLDLDYTEFNRERGHMFIFFCLSALLLLVFGGASYA